MPRVSTAATLAARQEEQTKMAELMAKNPEVEETVEYSEEEENQSDKIVVVRIPARFTEDKVKTLMGSMNAQLDGSGYRTVFVPEEVDIYFLGQDPPARSRWA
jgi:hypothetical protein